MCIWCGSSFPNVIYFSECLFLSNHIHLSIRSVFLCAQIVFGRAKQHFCSLPDANSLSLCLSLSVPLELHESEIFNSLIVVNGPTVRMSREERKNGKRWLKCSLNLVIAHQFKLYNNNNNNQNYLCVSVCLRNKHNACLKIVIFWRNLVNWIVWSSRFDPTIICIVLICFEHILIWWSHLSKVFDI